MGSKGELEAGFDRDCWILAMRDEIVPSIESRLRELELKADFPTPESVSEAINISGTPFTSIDELVRYANRRGWKLKVEGEDG